MKLETALREQFEETLVRFLRMINGGPEMGYADASILIRMTTEDPFCSRSGSIAFKVCPCGDAIIGEHSLPHCDWWDIYQVMIA